MKKYTHAWIAFKAIERLEKVSLNDPDKKPADGLMQWFLCHKDGVIQGAWYPDEIIKDNATSHVLKFTPAQVGSLEFRKLPETSLIYRAGKKSPLYNKPYTLDLGTNLPERCEAMSHSVIDNLRIQMAEAKGSPIAPTDNHLALILFMLSHYIADGHMPLHCDSRKFSDGAGLHGIIEGKWEDEVLAYYDIDFPNERFFYNKFGYPLLRNEAAGTQYGDSILSCAEHELNGRAFDPDKYGTGNTNVREYMRAVCQYAYLLSYGFLPQGYDETNLNSNNWMVLPGQTINFKDFSTAVLADAIDSVARVWLRVWRRYLSWRKDVGG